MENSKQTKPYQFINVNRVNEISDKLYKYVIEKTDILEKKWDWNTLPLKEMLNYIPELAEECSKIIPAPMTMISIVHRNPQHPIGIHVDISKYNHRVLWPIRNCQGSYTRFYDLNGNTVSIQKGKQGDAFKVISQTNPLIEIDAVELTGPIVFNTQIPHSVSVNPVCGEARLTATMGFGNFPIETLFNFNRYNL